MHSGSFLTIVTGFPGVPLEMVPAQIDHIKTRKVSVRQKVNQRAAGQLCLPHDMHLSVIGKQFGCLIFLHEVLGY